MTRLMSAEVEGSTVIKRIGWTDDVLTVLFHNGKAFAYDNVPVSVFNAFVESDSAGEFFNMRIRKMYAGGLVHYIDGNHNVHFADSLDKAMFVAENNWDAAGIAIDIWYKGEPVKYGFDMYGRAKIWS